MSGSNGNGRKAKTPGRIPLFESDPGVRAIIIEAVRDGMKDKDACRAADIHPGTLSRWKGEQGEAYREFRDELLRARMEGKRARLKIMREAAEGKVVEAFDENGEPVTIKVCGDWKAAAWLLARLHPEEFSEKRILEHRDDARAEKRRKALSDPDLRADLDRAARRMGSLREPG